MSLGNIPIDLIRPHPDNPRKDLGDLTELASSIEANGILQNLTVVEGDGKYYVCIIGHRRLEAAKLAGLTEVPCAVVKMSEKEQLATMLTENIQRADLTIFEQAKGFQMMFDLGESVESVAKQTGFSATTVRHRMKLLELDQEELEISAQKQVRITDYIELEKIEDLTERNEVLKKIGTKDFEWEVDLAIRRQERHSKLNAAIETLRMVPNIKECKPKEMEDKKRLTLLSPYNDYDYGDFEFEEDVQYYFCTQKSDFWIYVYTDETDEDDDEEDEEVDKQALLIEAKQEELTELKKAAHDKRFEFYQSLSEHSCRTAMTEIYDLAVKANFVKANFLLHSSLSTLFETFAIVTDKKPWELRYADVENEVKKSPYKALLIATVSGIENGYCDKNDKNNDLQRIIYAVKYVESDEEVQLRYKTHPLYAAIKELEEAR